MGHEAKLTELEKQLADAELPQGADLPQIQPFLAMHFWFVEPDMDRAAQMAAQLVAAGHFPPMPDPCPELDTSLPQHAWLKAFLPGSEPPPGRIPPVEDVPPDPDSDGDVVLVV
jgi:hypothetical protein